MGRCRCLPLFGKATFCLISVLFFVVTALTASLIASNNYNTDPPTNGWILVGGLQSDSVTFRIRNPSSSSSASQRPQRFDVSTSSDQVEASKVYTGELTGDNLVESVDVTGLSSETRYYYWTSDQDGNILQRGQFMTPAPEGSRFNFTIAAGGCAWTGSKNDIFNHIADEDPLLFLHLGDMHYEDINADDVEIRIDAIDKVLGSPSQANLFGKTSFVVQWDDHDWLGNDSSGYCPVEPEPCQGREAALESYRVGLPYYEPLPASVTQGNETVSIDASYHAFTIGTVRFIISDLRSGQSEESIYTDEQKAWLFSELASASEYDFVVWVTPSPWLGKAKEDESWFGFPDDRSELSDYITPTLGGPDGPQNLIALSADAHMLAFDDGRNTYYGTLAPPSADVLSFPILMSGPLDRLGSAKGGPFSQGCTTIELERNNQYSTLDFVFPDDEGGDACIDIKSYRIEGFTKKTVIDNRLCGNIFHATDAVGTGSCDSSYLSTASAALVGVSGVLCFAALVMSCRYFERCDALATSFIVLISWLLIYILGIYIPRGAMDIGNFEIMPVAIICVVYTFTACVYLWCWNRKSDE